MGLGGIVKGTRTTLRAPMESDLPMYARWMADQRVRRACGVWFEPAMPATWKRRLADATKEPHVVLWSIDADDRLVGMARIRFDFSPLSSGIELRYFLIDPDEWHRGCGFDAALALHRYIFDYLNMRWSECEIRAGNVPALRVAEKLGYREYARGHAVYYSDGTYADQVRLRMDLDIWNERWATEREYPRLDPALLS